MENIVAEAAKYSLESLARKYDKDLYSLFALHQNEHVAVLKGLDYPLMPYGAEPLATQYRYAFAITERMREKDDQDMLVRILKEIEQVIGMPYDVLADFTEEVDTAPYNAKDLVAPQWHTSSRIGRVLPPKKLSKAKEISEDDPALMTSYLVLARYYAGSLNKTVLDTYKSKQRKDLPSTIRKLQKTLSNLYQEEDWDRSARRQKRIMELAVSLSDQIRRYEDAFKDATNDQENPYVPIYENISAFTTAMSHVAYASAVICGIIVRSTIPGYAQSAPFLDRAILSIALLYNDQGLVLTKDCFEAIDCTWAAMQYLEHLVDLEYALDADGQFREKRLTRREMTENGPSPEELICGCTAAILQHVTHHGVRDQVIHAISAPKEDNKLLKTIRTLRTEKAEQMRRIQALEEQCARFEKQLERKSDTSECERRLVSLQKENASLLHDLRKAEEEIEELDETVDELKSPVFMQEDTNSSAEGEGEERGIPQDNPLSQIEVPDRILTASYLFLCGNTKMQHKVRSKFPNAIFSNGYTITQHSCKTLTAVICLTRQTSHTEYSRIKAQSANYDIPFIHYNTMNLDMLAAMLARDAETLGLQFRDS